MKICKIEGCGRKSRTRQMCGSHYMAWWRNAEFKPTPPNTRALIIECLPGTYREIAAASGLSYRVVGVVANELHAEGLIHIDHFAKSPSGRGSRYMKSFALGAGEDAKVSPQQKRADMLRRRREVHHIKVARRKPNGIFGALGL